MPKLQVLPRSTPEERHDTPREIDVDELVSEHAELLEGWVEHRQGWEFTLHEGHDFGRTNNVEGRLLFASGELSSSLLFRLDQVDAIDDTGEQLVLRFEERDGIAKLARCTANGLDVELHHILTFT
jgi:hypothetical protein